jgi:hypothetical protein
MGLIAAGAAAKLDAPSASTSSIFNSHDALVAAAEVTPARGETERVTPHRKDKR